jgi:hypothetical protein
MRIFTVGRPALGICAGAAMLAGCSLSGSVPPSQSLTNPSGSSASRVAAPAYEVLHAFRSPYRGMNPLAPVVADSSGNLFGETSQGGNPSSDGGCGSVFELTPSGTHYTQAILHRFRNNPDGCGPTGGLSIDSDGAIYGTTEFGGRTGAGAGTVFRLTPSGSGYDYSVLYRFKDHRDGARPVGGVMVGVAGFLYGATQYGASYACAKNTEGCGTVYALIPTGSGNYTESILHVFTGGRDGLLPGSGLAMDKYGSLYGTTTAGGGVGSIGVGTVFKVTITDSGPFERVIHSFEGGRDGSYPVAPVIVERNGTVIGTTLYGGSDDANCTVEGEGGNCGLIFRLTPSGSKYRETFLHRFRGGNDGSQPAAPLIDHGGVLYGTTTDGATGFPCRGECGTIFSLQPSGQQYMHAVLFRFNSRAGWFPRAGVIADKGGALYGTTYFQGRARHYAGGTVFKLTP